MTNRGWNLPHGVDFWADAAERAAKTWVGGASTYLLSQLANTDWHIWSWHHSIVYGNITATTSLLLSLISAHFKDSTASLTGVYRYNRQEPVR